MSRERRGSLEHQNSFKCLGLRAFNLSDDLRLVYSPQSRVAYLLTSSETKMLTSCSTFATIADHARRLRNSTSRARPTVDQIERRLAAFARSGPLKSHRWWADWVRRMSISDGSSPAPIATVGIPTRNRMGSMLRCLESYIVNSKEYGKTSDFVVMDDSDFPGHRAATIARLQSLRKKYGVTISYAGLRERARFAALLAHHENLPSEVTAFALLNPTRAAFSAGSCRNALLLHTVGDIAISVDDDTICRWVPSERLKDSLMLGSDWDPSEAWFFADARSIRKAMPPTTGDFLGTHERLLGKSLDLCLRTQPERCHLDLQRIEESFFENSAGSVPRVVTTNGGIAGENGLDGTESYWFLQGESHERLMASEESYRLALAGRYVIRVPRQVTISRKTFVSGANLGFDNRSLLPPFFPVHRLDDEMFGLCLRKTRPSYYFGWLPWTVLHLPPARRLPRPDAWMVNVLSLSVQDILPPLISSLPGTERVEDENQALGLFGKQVEELGRLSLTDFVQRVRLQLFESITGKLMLLNERIRDYGYQPGYWADDVGRYVNLASKALVIEDLVVPRDLLRGKDREGALRDLQNLVLLFGQVLQIWPHLVQAATELRRRGIRLAMPQ
jgi:hypothetical protein